MREIIKDYIKRFPDNEYLRYHAPRYATLLKARLGDRFFK